MRVAVRRVAADRKVCAVGIARFADYRQYEQVRVEASNAVMGLLAGAQMAAHMLQLTKGSDRLLPEIFPHIPHIGRLNLTTQAAQDILTAGDIHLGAMTVPYVLAIHEDYLKTCLTLLQRGSIRLTKPPGDLKLADQHEEIERATGKSFTATSLQQLHTLRLMRNCTIHSGGRVNGTLIRQLATWTPDAEAGWVKLTHRSPLSLQIGDRITFSHGEMLIALAVTKTLAREANQFLQPALPRDLWADLVIEDLQAENPSALAAPDTVRRATGFARFHYGPLKLTSTEIADAVSKH
jgi:hypothetical protein